MPIARTMPNMVSTLIEKPRPSITVKVPSRATGTTSVGIRVARKFCMNRYITANTSSIASSRGADHLPDRDLDERRGVIGDVVAHALREVARQLVEGGADALGGGHRVGAGRHLHRQAGGGHLVDPRDEAVLALAELDAGHVAQADRAAVGAGCAAEFRRTARASPGCRRPSPWR